MTIPVFLEDATLIAMLDASQGPLYSYPVQDVKFSGHCGFLFARIGEDIWTGWERLSLLKRTFCRGADASQSHQEIV